MGEATKSAKGNKQEGNIVCGEIGVEIVFRVASRAS